MNNLKFCLWTYRKRGHAQEEMKNLGITYKFAIPQSIADHWAFFACENIPDDLPDYLTPLCVDFEEYGHFSESQLDTLRKYESDNINEKQAS